MTNSSTSATMAVSGRIGLHIGQHNAHQLHTGEALDWWRVEHVDEPGFLRLRSLNLMPGRMWLELSLRSDGNGGADYHQRALFQPYGLAGLAYWKALNPFRNMIFGGIARNIVRASEHLSATGFVLPATARQRPASDDAEITRTGTR